VELGAAHRRWNSGADDLAEERVGVEQHVVVEEDVVDAHDALLAQHDVVGSCGAAVHREPEPEVRVVVRGSRRWR
jgi:hypothetical protein